MTHKPNYTYQFKDNEIMELRLISDKDSIEEITVLLNKSYQALLDKGMKFLAATQDSSVTLNRINKAHQCFVGVHNGRIISTISLYDYKPSDVSKWYNHNYVAKIGQFAVLPELQKTGIGSFMMEIVELEARQMKNIKELSLDTSEHAEHLIKYYKDKGYQYKETIQWDVTNYKSFVMSKALY